MYSLFVIISAAFIMLAIFGLFGVLAYYGVKGLMELSDEVRDNRTRKRIREMEMRRI